MEKPNTESFTVLVTGNVVFRPYLVLIRLSSSPLDCGLRPREGVRPVEARCSVPGASLESGCLGMQP